MTAPRWNSPPPDGAETVRLKALGALLADRRTRAGLTQAQLAARADVTTQTVRRYEQGRGRPSWRTLTKLAAALHPGDPVRARALADSLADAAGPSLAGDPRLPTALTREQVVAVLVGTMRALGLDPDDDRIRHIVVEQIRAVGGQPSGDQPALVAFAGSALTQNGGRP